MRALVLLWFLLSVAPAAAQFWACPSPCPVADATRLPDLVQAAQAAQQLVQRESQLSAMASTLAHGIGAAGTLFTPTVPPMPSLADMPTAPTAPLLSNLQIVRQTLFQLSGTALTSSQTSALQSARARASAAERSAAMAASLQQTAALSPLSGETATASALAGQSVALRNDVDSAAAVRLLLLADLANAARLVAAETSLAHSGAAMRYNQLAAPANP